MHVLQQYMLCIHNFCYKLFIFINHSLISSSICTHIREAKEYTIAMAEENTISNGDTLLNSSDFLLNSYGELKRLRGAMVPLLLLPIHIITCYSNTLLDCHN